MKSNSATHVSGTVTDLGSDAVVDVSGALRKLLADVFGLYVKTKNFHWHMSRASPQTRRNHHPIHQRYLAAPAPDRQQCRIRRVA